MEIPRSRYTFVTEEAFPAPLPKIWKEVLDFKSWPEWWNGVLESKVIAPATNDNCLGIRVKTAWRSVFPYVIRFTFEVVESAPPDKVVIKAVGDLEGTGTWELSERDGVSTVKFTWEVETTKPWMNFLAPLARPFFSYAHDHLMQKGAKGLRERLASHTP